MHNKTIKKKIKCEINQDINCFTSGMYNHPKVSVSCDFNATNGVNYTFAPVVKVGLFRM